MLFSASIFTGNVTAAITDKSIIPASLRPQSEEPEKIPLLKLPQNASEKVIIPKGAPFIPLGNVYVAWMEAGGLLFKRSIDGGETFTPTAATTISNDPKDYPQPALISSKNTIYLVWMSHVTFQPYNKDIFLKRSTDGGKSFTPEEPINISNTPINSGMFGTSPIAVDSKNNLYVV